MRNDRDIVARLSSRLLDQLDELDRLRKWPAPAAGDELDVDGPDEAREVRFDTPDALRDAVSAAITKRWEGFALADSAVALLDRDELLKRATAAVVDLLTKGNTK